MSPDDDTVWTLIRDALILGALIAGGMALAVTVALVLGVSAWGEAPTAGPTVTDPRGTP